MTQILILLICYMTLLFVLDIIHDLRGENRNAYHVQNLCFQFQMKGSLIHLSIKRALHRSNLYLVKG